MKVLFDHQIFTLQKYGGVSKYFFELIKHLSNKEWDTTVIFSNNEYLKYGDLIKHIQVFPNQMIKGIPRILNEISKPYSSFKIYQGDFDVFHQTDFQTYCLPLLKNKPMVTTFHDMNFSTHDKNEKLVENQKKSVERADKIIAVSQNTKNDLIDMWNIPTNKIEVVYHGVNTPFEHSIVGKRKIEHPYILFVGLRKEFKNFKRLALAFSYIKQKHPSVKLVCTSVPFSAEEIKLANDLSITKDMIHISASEITMANLYSYAELFVYPSIYEGFGMPILEAMSYGCPTAISNSSCFPEIARDASIYFDPFDVESMSYAILQLLENNTARKSIIEKGYLLCNEFTWDKTAEGHRRVYNSLIV